METSLTLKLSATNATCKSRKPRMRPRKFDTTNSANVPISDAASQLNVCEKTIRNWQKRGLIRSRGDITVTEIQLLKQRLGLVNQGQHFSVLKQKTTSKLKVIELFAGCGGLALGLENAGIVNQICAVEWDHWACETLRKNRPQWNIAEGDICKLNDTQFFQNLEADIITGGFPCQAFSYSGKRLGFNEQRGILFFEMLKAIQTLRPKVVIGENVKGLLRHNGGKTIAAMEAALKDQGYNVEKQLLRAQFLDVPQKRERVIIIGIREDIDAKFHFPKEKDHLITLEAALKDVPKSKGTLYPPSKRKILELVPEGGYWRDLPEDLQKQYMGKSYHLTGGKTGMARRLAWNEPSLTLTCAPAQKQTERCHPKETRPLTIREYARIQSFPDEWEFMGPITSQYKQIGNAVPVNLGYHIGCCLREMLRETLD